MSVDEVEWHEWVQVDIRYIRRDNSLLRTLVIPGPWDSCYFPSASEQRGKVL